MRKNKLRIGLILDDLSVAAWKLRLIEVVQNSDYAEISLVVLTGRNPLLQPKAPSGPLAKVLDTVERFLVGRPGHIPDAFDRRDARQLLAGATTLEIHPIARQSFDYVEGDDLARIKDRSLDVLIQLSDRNLRGGVLQVARCGMWSLHIGDNREDEPDVAGRTEVLQSLPVIASELEVQTNDVDEPMILCRSYSSTNAASLLDNASRVLWKSLHFVPRLLKELHESGEETFFARVRERNVHSQYRGRKSRRRLTNGKRLVLLWKKLLEALLRKWNARFHYDQWLLLYAFQSDISTDLSRFKHILPPKDRFWADPFIVSRDGKFYVFFEELLYSENKGKISVLEIDKDGTIQPQTTVLETPYHLSYPFVFEFENSLYMIPESKQNRTIELYKCTEFPLKWEFEKNLMENCMATDATLMEWHGKWWMFVSQIETEGASTWDELFLYFSDSPLSSRWTPHPLNPVVSDVRSARPAGRLFERQGRLFRPSQNSSGHYGYGFNLCEIVEMSETEYEETVTERVEPKRDTNVTSTHTFNHANGLTIIDGQLRRRL